MEALSRTRRLATVARRHRVFVVALFAGFALRVMTQFAYRPALLYIDSFRYLSTDMFDRFDPSGLNPIGYDVLLHPVLWMHNLAAVAAVQHAMGLAMAVALYLVLLRKGVRPWVAGLATVPLLLDAYQLQIEQNVMADTLFEALVLAAVVVLVWPERIGYRQCLAAGALLGLSVTVRLVGEPLIVPAAVFVLIASRGRWTVRVGMAALTAAAFAVPLLLYAWNAESVTGNFSITTSDTGALYARAVSVVDCSTISIPSYERVLCPPEPIGHRNVDIAAHNKVLLSRVKPPNGMTASDVQRDFSMRVLRQQPLDVMVAVLGDFGHGFAPFRNSYRYEVPIYRWQFQHHYPKFPGYDPTPLVDQFGGGPPRVTSWLASFLRGYQLWVGYVPGPVLAAGFLLGVLAFLGVGRARRSSLRAAALVVTSIGLLVLLTADFFEFSWRYQLPGLIFAPFAGALGATAVFGARRRLLAPELDDVDRAAMAAFRAGDGEELGSTPVVVVIAAYNEEASVGDTLDELPRESMELAVQSLVVVDGGTDRTAEIARAHGGLVCVVPTNRGQGAALRLGYALARTGATRFIVTTDADGQYVGSELDVLLEPLVDGRAEFVTGSRWLGHQETTDRIRRLGSRFFAWLASRLARQHLTDTSFGFRAMTVEVAGAIALRQPQYQSAELLMQVLARGFRVVEVPMTMRRRVDGRSKKGRWIVYGGRYARVLLGTWWRERRRPRRSARTQVAPEGMSTTRGGR